VVCPDNELIEEVVMHVVIAADEAIQRVDLPRFFY